MALHKILNLKTPDIHTYWVQWHQVAQTEKVSGDDKDMIQTGKRNKKVNENRRKTHKANKKTSWTCLLWVLMLAVEYQIVGPWFQLPSSSMIWPFSSSQQDS